MAKNWMERASKIPGFVDGTGDPYSYVLRSSSPGVNSIFGGAHGLPLSYTAIFWGLKKGGKSFLTNDIIGQLHQDDPEAVAAKFNTEHREMLQMTAASKRMFRIDPNRYMAFEDNTPNVFDRVEKDIASMCDDGMPLKLVVIDSVSALQGRRMVDAESVNDQQIGDLAQTVQDGLKRILPYQRRHKFSVILVAQARAEMDALEQKRGNKIKMQGGMGMQHFAEFFLLVEEFRNKEGKTDALGQKFEDDALEDMVGNKERTGHKCRVTMKDSSMGPKGRQAIFTLDYKRGIINQHEEVLDLGIARGIIERVGNASYKFGDKKWVGGKPAILEALQNDQELQKAVIGELRMQDLRAMQGAGA